MRHSPSFLTPLHWLMTGAALTLLAFSLRFDLRQTFHLAQFKPDEQICQEKVEPKAVLSREELAVLLQVPERSQKAEVRSLVQHPYCVLSPLEVRAGVKADREAYPLEFDPDVWLIVLYEQGEYAGYDFVFRR